MLTITHVDYIRDLYFSEGKTYAEINQITGRNYRTIKKYVLQEDFNLTTHQVLRPNRSEVLRPIIHQWLQEDQRRPPKQRHTATRIFARLQQEHPEILQVSRRTVSTMVREEKRKVFGGTKAYLNLAHPGGEAQVDFGHLYAYEQSIYTKFCYLVLSFPKSNAGFAVLTRSETREALLEGLIQLFTFIGFVPTNIWFDQMSSAALRSRNDQGRVVACEPLIRFANHYGFRATFCNPNSGHEKGNVENKVGTLRRNLFVPEPSFSDLATYNQELLHQCAQRHGDNHYLHLRPIHELFIDETALMKPVNSIRFDASRLHTARVNKQGLVRFETGLYSVSPTFVGELVALRIHAEQVEIYTKDCSRRITTHPRLFGEGKQSIHHVDFIDLVKVRPRALKYSGIYQLLPDNWREYLGELPKSELQEALEVLKNILLHEDCHYAKAVLDETMNYEHLTPQSIHLTYRRLKENHALYRGSIDVGFLQPGLATDWTNYSQFMGVNP